MFILWIVTFVLCLVSVLMVDRLSITISSIPTIKPQIEQTSHLVIEILLLTATFLLLTDNRTGVDIINYHNWFMRDESIAGREVLYTLLRNYAHVCGMNFYMFRALVSFVSCLIPVFLLRKEKQNIAFFLAIYLPSLLFFDSMQFRNQIAICIIIGGSFLLVKKDNIKNKIIFVLIVALAMQFHTFAIAYLVFIFVCSKYKKIWGYFFLIMGALLLVITLVNNRSVPLVDVLYSWILSSVDTRAYKYSFGHNIFLYPTAVHIFTTILSEYSLLWWNKNLNNQMLFQYRYVQFINSVNKMFFIFIPFILMNTTFYRLLRNMFVFNIIAVGFSYRICSNQGVRLLLFTCLLFISILWIAFAVFFYSTSEIIIDPVLKDGVLFFISE